jgi:hypothetical protein
MPPPLSKAVYATRPQFDPPPAVFTLQDLLNYEDDLKQHRLSDHVIGVMLMSIHRGYLTRVRASNFETVFTTTGRIRRVHRHFGHPFLDPDGYVLTADGVVLRGDDHNVRQSPYTLLTVKNHPDFIQWYSGMTGL